MNKRIAGALLLLVVMVGVVVLATARDNRSMARVEPREDEAGFDCHIHGNGVCGPNDEEYQDMYGFCMTYALANPELAAHDDTVEACMNERLRDWRENGPPQ